MIERPVNLSPPVRSAAHSRYRAQARARILQRWSVLVLSGVSVCLVYVWFGDGRRIDLAFNDVRVHLPGIREYYARTGMVSFTLPDTVPARKLALVGGNVKYEDINVIRRLWRANRRILLVWTEYTRLHLRTGGRAVIFYANGVFFERWLTNQRFLEIRREQKAFARRHAGQTD